MKPQREFQDLEQASKQNFEFLRELFKYSDKFKLFKPRAKNSCYDGILTTTKDGVDVSILVEVKLRNFDSFTLETRFNNELFLEKTKYDRLKKARLEMLKHPGRKIHIWYINRLSDRTVLIFNLTDETKRYKWESINMNEVTYKYVNDKVPKKVTKLDVKDVIMREKCSFGLPSEINHTNPADIYALFGAQKRLY